MLLNLYKSPWLSSDTGKKEEPVRPCPPFCFAAELLVLDFGGDCEERGVLQNGRSVKKLPWTAQKRFLESFFRLVSGTHCWSLHMIQYQYIYNRGLFPFFGQSVSSAHDRWKHGKILSTPRVSLSDISRFNAHLVPKCSMYGIFTYISLWMWPFFT